MLLNDDDDDDMNVDERVQGLPVDMQRLE